MAHKYRRRISPYEFIEEDFVDILTQDSYDDVFGRNGDPRNRTNLSFDDVIDDVGVPEILIYLHTLLPPNSEELLHQVSHVLDDDPFMIKESSWAETRKLLRGKIEAAMLGDISSTVATLTLDLNLKVKALRSSNLLVERIVMSTIANESRSEIVPIADGTCLVILPQADTELFQGKTMPLGISYILVINYPNVMGTIEWYGRSLLTSVCNGAKELSAPSTCSPKIKPGFTHHAIYAYANKVFHLYRRGFCQKIPGLSVELYACASRRDLQLATLRYRLCVEQGEKTPATSMFIMRLMSSDSSTRYIQMPTEWSNNYIERLDATLSPLPDVSDIFPDDVISLCLSYDDRIDWPTTGLMFSRDKDESWVATKIRTSEEWWVYTGFALQPEKKELLLSVNNSTPIMVRNEMGHNKGVYLRMKYFGGLPLCALLNFRSLPCGGGMQRDSSLTLPSSSSSSSSSSSLKQTTV